MKYLVNRKTKEHCVYPEGYEYNCIQFAEVQADPEGWIKHTGAECPLPDDALCDLKWNDGKTTSANVFVKIWHLNLITHYRPILEPKETTFVFDAKFDGVPIAPTPAPQYDPRSVSFNPIDRLKSARQAARVRYAVVIPDAKVWNQAEGRDGKQYADGWNACREAMLAAQSQENEE